MWWNFFLGARPFYLGKKTLSKSDNKQMNEHFEFDLATKVLNKENCDQTSIESVGKHESWWHRNSGESEKCQCEVAVRSNFKSNLFNCTKQKKHDVVVKRV